MATSIDDAAKLRKLGDILDGWTTAPIRAPSAELAKVPMLFGNDAFVTVMQREAGEPIREQLAKLNELRLTLDKATDNELAETVTVDPPRWAKASPPQTRTREDDLRQKVASIASHLSMIVRHAADATEAKTPAAPNPDRRTAAPSTGNGEPLTDTEAASAGAPRLIVNDGARSIVIDGNEHEVQGVRAWNWAAGIIRANGRRVSAPNGTRRRDLRRNLLEAAVALFRSGKGGPGGGTSLKPEYRTADEKITN